MAGDEGYGGGGLLSIYKGSSRKVWIAGPVNLIEAEGVIRGVPRSGGTVRIVPQPGRIPFGRPQMEAGQPKERVKNSLK